MAAPRLLRFGTSSWLRSLVEELDVYATGMAPARYAKEANLGEGKGKQRDGSETNIMEEKQRDMQAAKEALEWARDETPPRMRMKWSSEVFQELDRWERRVSNSRDGRIATRWNRKYGQG